MSEKNGPLPEPSEFDDYLDERLLYEYQQERLLQDELRGRRDYSYNWAIRQKVRFSESRSLRLAEEIRRRGISW